MSGSSGTSKGEQVNIGLVAKASGVSRRMIRHYEKCGLLPPAVRRDSGYRDYGDQDVHRLRFIARARDLGFPINEIAALLSLWSNRARASSDVKALANRRIAELATKEAALKAMRSALEHLARECGGDERSDCPILDDLSATRAAPVTAIN